MPPALLDGRSRRCKFAGRLSRRRIEQEIKRIFTCKTDWPFSDTLIRYSKQAQQVRRWFDPPLRLEKSSSIARPANYFTTGNTVNVPSLCRRPLKVTPLNRRTKEFIIWWKPVIDGLYLAPFIQMSKVGVAMATTFFFYRLWIFMNRDQFRR